MTGKRIAHFEITGKLGEGGMGVVYEAVDRSLDRRVALKILPPDKVANASRKQRFIQEAKAASALNHPNIITIYEIGAEDGVDYIAMELVTGRTLEEVLAKRRLKVAEVLKQAVQIADALAAAHAVGIVHRDLKPANVMIADSGLVKVLDFGLAKLTDDSEVSEDDVTRTERALTEDGTVVGSAPYMSPEQAEGRKVDARSDIFSFGLVLYEMLSGKRAFRGETRMATLAAILNQEPAPLGELVPGMPRELERIVARCIRKDLARRSQSMAEIKVALEELKEETESGISKSAPVEKRKAAGWKRWAALGGVVVALGAALAFTLPRWREARAPLKEVPLTSFPGYQGQPTLSPDGSQFAFVWDGGQEGAPRQLYVSLVGRGTPLRLTNTPPGTEVYNPAWSPDGQTIAFVRAPGPLRLGELILIPALGGPERRLDEAGSTQLAWSPDGKWLYFATRLSGKFVIGAEPSAGGETRQLTDPPAGARDYLPSASPDGRHLVFSRAAALYNEDLFIADLQDGNRIGAVRQLTSDHLTKYSTVWTADGQDIVYVAGEPSSLLGMYRVRASGGAPSRMEGIGDYARDVAVASRGHRLVYSRSLQDYNLWRMPLRAVGATAGQAERILMSTRYEASGSYSPDGKRIAFSSNRGGVRQIWVADADGSDPVPLTSFTAGVAGSPKWSPDGQTIVFDARPEGSPDIYSIGANGGVAKRLTDHVSSNTLPCFSADGRWIYFHSRRTGQTQLFRMPAGGGPFAQITRGGLSDQTMVSPDGRWVYFGKFGSIWKAPAEGGEETAVVDGRDVYNDYLFAVAESGIYFPGARDPASGIVPLRLYRFADGKVVELGHFTKPPANLPPSVSPDEKWLLYAQLDSSVDDVMLVENFQ
jgi:Tol biopolymer transport system component/tRNA A-37 threonylcarbamoyl transferase component Bud32